MNAFALKRIAWLLAPTVLGLAIPYLGTSVWPPLVNLQIGLPILGFTITVLITGVR